MIKGQITKIQLRTILDSRGNATVEADIFTESGFGRAAAPSGASTGMYEATALPARVAIDAARERVLPALSGFDTTDQQGFDDILRDVDGTENFSSIGANVAVALSLANAKAAASSLSLPLFRYLGGAFATRTPYPLGNVIGGGAHAAHATDIQEFLVVPTGAIDADEAIFANAAVHHKIKELLISGGNACGKGDEGAWAPSITDIEAFDLVQEAINAVSDDLMIEIRMGIDVAASELWKDGVYRYRDAQRSTEDQVTYMAELVDRYELAYVEDPIVEEDFEGFSALTELVGDGCLICGDDLYVTNVERIEMGIDACATNCVLIKPNQIGTLSDTFEAIRMAHSYGMETVMSHRSGETTDDTIAHLATAFDCIYLKTGAVGGERIAKLNELVRIEEMIQ
jgi:enolase